MKESIHLISLGCAKNLVDSENILGILKNEGFSYTPQADRAQILIINTCGFIQDAAMESIKEILTAAELKNASSLKVLLVAGCLAARYRYDLLKRIPEIDAIVSPANIHRIAGIIKECLTGKKAAGIKQNYDCPGLLPRQLTASPHSVYLKIADGCNHNCKFCIIPQLRGKYRSRPMEALVKEARELAEQGAREVILVAQDTTYYGSDIYGRRTLPRLLHELAAIEKISWIRILYGNPHHIDEALLKTIATEPKVLKYLDVPLQHVSQAVLKAMGRGNLNVEQFVCRVKERVPGLVLRSTFMVGFPGESRVDFRKLLAFFNRRLVDRAGIFAFSPEEGTPAACFPLQIPAGIKKKRYHKAMQLLRLISLENNKRLLGKNIVVMVDRKNNGFYQGRYYGQAPEVDGMVLFKSHKKLIPGELVKVLVTGVSHYDLLGEVANDIS
ncbi:MAG TPA: 30S ribosomal protein S12 methylthiotransferase RimO [Firmicutes bacterium]|nr:30S ribosomal protein S12 methylthiotransferase RimO [Bacillota bacterium]